MVAHTLAEFFVGGSFLKSIISYRDTDKARTRHEIGVVTREKEREKRTKSDTLPRETKKKGPQRRLNQRSTHGSPVAIPCCHASTAVGSEYK